MKTEDLLQYESMLSEVQELLKADLLVFELAGRNPAVFARSDGQPIMPATSGPLTNEVPTLPFPPPPI